MQHSKHTIDSAVKPRNDAKQRVKQKKGAITIAPLKKPKTRSLSPITVTTSSIAISVIDSAISAPPAVYITSTHTHRKTNIANSAIITTTVRSAITPATIGPATAIMPSTSCHRR